VATPRCYQSQVYGFQGQYVGYKTKTVAFKTKTYYALDAKAIRPRPMAKNLAFGSRLRLSGS